MLRNRQRLLARIDDRAGAMIERLERWARIPSGSRDLEGLGAMARELETALGALGPVERVALSPQRDLADDATLVDRPLGEALRVRKRPDAARRALLAIHMDTVHERNPPFPVERLDADTLRGPGVADAKGGLVVLLAALEAFEETAGADAPGWEVWINPDEELGSPGSGPLLARAAARADVGLVYEPALPHGGLIGARRGSGNFAVAVRGRAAHAGRAFAEGRSAVAALAALITRLHGLNEELAGVTVNVGRIAGGGPVNIVPDTATARFNVRYDRAADEPAIRARLEALVGEIDGREGLAAELHGGFTAPPKPLDAATERLLEGVFACGRSVGLRLTHEPSGGVCDGNRLAAAGLPTVDTLGPRGSGLHSREETVALGSLAERAKVSALLLASLADRSLPWPRAGAGGDG